MIDVDQLKKDFSVAFQLSAVSRYSRDHMLKSESVLEHVGFCNFYCLLLADRYERRTGKELNYRKLFRGINVHDLDESVMGDIPRTTKYFSEAMRENFSVAENITIRKLSEWMRVDVTDDWREAKKGIEGEILKMADVASLVFKCWMELKMLGNRSFLRVALEVQNHLVNFDLKSISVFFHDDFYALEKLNVETLGPHSTGSEDYLFLNMKELKA